jgi:hypothetical protein
MKKIVFNINGGIGKCVAATAVCAAIKKQYPEYELIVVSGYPDVFINNPNVKKSFAFGQTSYFYQDYIRDKDVKIFFHDPYLTTDYVKKNKHLIQIWCELYGVKYNGEIPEIFITEREVDYFHKQVNVQKPILLMQTNGGGDMNKKYSWARDLPVSVVMPIIDHFKQEYDIIHVRREDQQEYPSTIRLTASFRQVVATSMLSTKRLVMDSFLQHALAAINLPAVACWVVNSPKVFGYDLHTHIVANPFTREPELRNAYIEQFNIGGDELEFPYNHEREIFSVDQIIKALENQKTIAAIKPVKNDGKIQLPI